MTNAVERDFLAFVNMPYGGGSWARGKDREETIKRAATICRSDWKHLFKFGPTLNVCVVEVTGRDQIQFGEYECKDLDTGESLREKVEVEVYTFARKKKSK